jgi:hypothetical protein
MGEVYVNLGDTQKALISYKQALIFYRGMKDQVAEVTILKGMSRVYSMMRDKKKLTPGKASKESL